eukprot:894837-Prymnesium_polylepis.2
MAPPGGSWTPGSMLRRGGASGWAAPTAKGDCVPIPQLRVVWPPTLANRLLESTFSQTRDCSH